MKILKKLFASEDARTLKKYEKVVEKVNSFEDTISALSDENLKKKTEEFKNRLKDGETLNDILPEAFATVREASRRLSGERHYDVQIIGGAVIHDGNISEMRTGEGKTLVATLPAYLNALEGKGVHVVTVNDYLARRDAAWMGQIYHFLGLSCAVINQDESYMYDPAHGQDSEEDKERDEEGSYKVVYEFLKPCTRIEAYDADITYGTNNQFGFDYLRDNLAHSVDEIRQKQHNFAIVDEIDSILIDEARTPLIISMPAAAGEDLYRISAQIVQNFRENEDYTIDEKLRSVYLTDAGIEKAEKTLGVDNIYTEKGIKYVHHLETAAKAKALYNRDKEYVVRDDEVIIVDEFTGRLQPGRRWSDGLHQAVEAKEGVKVQQESRTFATTTYQNYFKMYEKLSGMTGTAKTSAEEFFKVYKLDTVIIPTNKPIARIDHNDLIFQTEKGKFTALARKVREINKKGQPVLIGTVSIEMNEVISSYLQKEGVPHEVLNAKNHEREGEIIARAGEKGAVTVATNMAGRGVDIKLGGIPFNKEKAEEIKSLGGLHVIGTERHDARRIDNQLRGRSGRQGDPGETQFYVSLEDKLMRIFASDGVKKMMGRFGLSEDQPIESKMITRSLESAQKKIEGMHFDSRKSTLDYDNVMNTQRESVYTRRRKILEADNSEIDGIVAEILKNNPDIFAIAEKKKEEVEDYYKIIRLLLLQVIDQLWVDHLEVMSYTESSVRLRAVGQRDPLIEYQKEGLRLFKEMNDILAENIARMIPHIGEGIVLKEEARHQKDLEKMEQSGGDSDASTPYKKAKKENEYGRNDIVTIEKDGEEKEMKYKKAESLLVEGWKVK